jgi:acyl-CoA thioester hydrolase
MHHLVSRLKMSATEELLEPYPITMQIPVYWGDHDAMQHVNNTVYIRWMEHVRLLFFDAIGVSESMKQTGVGTILASIQCRYRAPVTFPDTIHAGARAVSLGEDRMVIHHRLVSEQLGVVAAEGEGLGVCYDYRTNQKAPMPPEMRERLLTLQSEIPVLPTD